MPEPVCSGGRASAIEPGTELRLDLDQFSPEERSLIQPEVQSNPDVGVAEWTGLGLRNALRWRVDGKTYSATGLVKEILDMSGCDVHNLAEHRYWRIPDGRTLSKAGSIIEDLAEAGS